MTDWVGEMSSRVSVLASATSLPLLVGHFRCEPDDPAWREVNRVGDVPHVVVPRTAVSIAPVDDEPIAADANRVVLYDAGQEYRRRPIDPRGDDCLFLAVGDDLVDRLGGGSGLVDRRRHRFAVRERSCPPRLYAEFQRLRTGAAPALDDPLVVDEHLLRLTCEVLDATPATPADGPGHVTEAVRHVLASRYAEPLSLADLGTIVGMSPYHLHRRFRAETGWTVHTYRDHLRLREGLARVLDGADDLAALAFDLGYSSHSHFTARFRRTFGETPSAVREQRRVA